MVIMLNCNVGKWVCNLDIKNVDIYMTKLTNKQRCFIDEYLIDFNATQAAIRSGYSAKTARQIGHSLLTKVDIKYEIESSLFETHKAHRRTFITASTLAIQTLLEVMHTGDHTNKIRAANSILDRAGHTGIDVESLRPTVVNSKDSEVERSLAIENLLSAVKECAEKNGMLF